MKENGVNVSNASRNVCSYYYVTYTIKTHPINLAGKTVPQHVTSGPDLHQQRIIAMRNASAMKKKIEQEKMIEAEVV